MEEFSEPADMTAVDVRAAIAEGKLSSRALVEACVSRIDELNPTVNAMVALNIEEALAQADALDELGATAGSVNPSGIRANGALHGLPIAVKDIQDVAGLPTTWGSPDLKDARAKADAAIVARIKRAGGVVLGKTNVPEKSIGANTVNPLFGATGNPFNPALTCGGSSGGSGVAVATGMVPLATGSDHGGSLRIPACYSSVVGVRATPGLVPNEQRQFPHTNYAVQGPMARTVRDAALLLSVIAQRDEHSRMDPMVFPFDASTLANPEAVDLARLSVGYSEDLGGVLVSQAVRTEFRRRIEALRPLVGSCLPCKVDLHEAPAVDWHLRQELFAAAYAHEARSWGENFNPNVRATFESAIATPMQDIAAAKRQQLELTRRMVGCFDEFDIVIAPGVSISPFPWRQLNPARIDGQPVKNYMGWLELTAALTVVGHPVVALPCGADSNSLPFGIQVIGAMYEDRALLGAAIALEDAFAQDELLRAPRFNRKWLARQNAGCRTDGLRVQSNFVRHKRRE